MSRRGVGEKGRRRMINRERRRRKWERLEEESEEKVKGEDR